MSRLTDLVDEFDPAVVEGLRLIGRRLLAEIDPIADILVTQIFEQEPAYRPGQTVDVAELRSTVLRNLTAVFSAIGGSRFSGESFEENGRRRIDSSIPLHAVLHAYQIGGLVQWESFGRVASTVPNGDRVLAKSGAYVWSIINSASQHVTHGYQAELFERQRRSATERTALFETILDGGFLTPAELADAADSLRLPITGTFVILGLRSSVAPSETSFSPAQLLVGGSVNVKSEWRTEASLHIGLVSLAGEQPRSIGATAVEAAGRAIGMSEVFHHLHQAPEALRQAKLAALVAASRPDARAAVRYEDVPLQAMMIVAPEMAQQLRSWVLGPLDGLDSNERRTLLVTLTAWIRADGSINETAKGLYVHRNSIARRLERILEVTGHDPRTPRGMAMLFTAREAEALLENL